MSKTKKSEYDFRRATRAAVIPVPKGKTRITIRLDKDVLDWFREQVNRAGGGNYQSLINETLRQHMYFRQLVDQPESGNLQLPINNVLVRLIQHRLSTQTRGGLLAMVRRVVREELRRAG
jgi:uncharacterized protein (DUF4415 family)